METSELFDLLRIAAVIAALLALVAGLSYGVWRAIKSPVRPLWVFARAWEIFFYCARANVWLLAAVAAALAAGQALQALFQAHPGLGQAVGQVPLMVASIGWQCLLAVFLALCAGKFHLSIIPIVTRGVRGVEITPPGFFQIALPVALWGGMLWLYGYALHVLSNVALVNSSAMWFNPLTALTSVTGYLLMAPFVLIRPAIAFGRDRPVLTGLLTALQNLPALVLVLILLVVPPLVFGVVLTALRPAFLLSEAIFLVFSFLQFLAYEAATLIFFSRVVMRPVGFAVPG